MKKSLLLLSTALLMSCSSSENAECTTCQKAPTTILIPNTYNTIKLNSDLEIQLKANPPQKAAAAPVSGIKNVLDTPKDLTKVNGALKQNTKKSLAEYLTVLSQSAREKWGAEGYQQSSKHRYVKYFDAYSTRADIQFDAGKIIISTLAKEESNKKLTAAIVQTLLMPQVAKMEELFSTMPFQTDNRQGGLLFQDQIRDQDNQLIEWEWRAKRFAQYLVANKRQQKAYQKGLAEFVEINLVPNHMAIRQKSVASYVKSSAEKYQLSEHLINALIQTESSFNPFSITQSGGLGMMQIMPKTAGADVFQWAKNLKEVPTADYLLNAENNIDVGSAYLNIIFHKYLKGIHSPESKHFAMISAYNSGTRSMFTTFNSDPVKAVATINQNVPEQVYQKLINQHPRPEARAYLEKVVKTEKELNTDKV